MESTRLPYPYVMIIRGYAHRYCTVLHVAAWYKRPVREADEGLFDKASGREQGSSSAGQGTSAFKVEVVPLLYSWKYWGL